MLTIKNIEAAIIDTVRTNVPWLRECGTVADFLAGDLDRIAKRTPAVYVAYEGGEYDYATGALDRRMIFQLLCVSEHPRGDAAARHGTGADRGVYEVMDAVLDALIENPCGLDIDPLLPLDEEAVGGTDTTAVYGIRFQTRCRRQP